MRRILILVALSLFLCSTASAFQGGGGESTKKGSSKKAVAKKKTSGTTSNNTTSPTIYDGGTVKTFRAPSKDVPHGMAFVGDDLWVAQGKKLWKLDGKGGVISEWGLPGLITDLASDGKLLYALEYGWTTGEPIYVIDPAKPWEQGRTIITEANRKNRYHSAYGVACRDGKLYVLDSSTGWIHVVNPADGTIERTIETGEKWISGLGFDGKHLVTSGSAKELLFLDADTGKAVRRVPVNSPLRVVEPHGGRLYLMEGAVISYDVNNKPIAVWPKDMMIYIVRLPVE
ncbi:MAG TPA: hypothetical protein VIT88_10675 [Pyrinomonadaceae bacterium]